MSDIKELVKRLRTFAQDCRDSMWQSRSETIRLMDEAANALEALQAECAQWQEAAGQAAVRGEHLEDRCEALERERDEARAELVARANSMLRLRDSFINMRNELEDEGDRVYFGSTNDADEFREVVRDLEDWNWHDVMRDLRKDDVFENSRQAHARAESAEAEVARLREALEWVAGPNWADFDIDSSNAQTAGDIVAEMQRIARAALSEGKVEEQQ